MELSEAIKNIRIALDNVVGTKQQHITIDQCFQIILSNLKQNDKESN